jgi:phosphatidylglycerophosphatase A
MKPWFIELIASAGFSGYFPFASGTLASAVGWLLYLGLRQNTFLLGSWIVVGFFVGVWVSTRAEKIYKEKDSHKIVIDEVVGFWISVFLLPQTWVWALAGFLLFRLFDVWKPWVIRKIQAWPGGWGVMMDDVLAGILANVLLQLARTIFFRG